MFENAKILVADDDPDFVLLLRTAFECAGFAGKMTAVSDGLNAVRYLKGEGRFGDREEYPFPELMLLDLRLPRLNGLEVLEWIRSQAEFDSLNVLVLTGTEIEEEVRRVRQAGASGVLIKPFEFGQLVRMAEEIAGSWLHAPHLQSQ